MEESALHGLQIDCGFPVLLIIVLVNVWCLAYGL
jgi:hypothetical protein